MGRLARDLPIDAEAWLRQRRECGLDTVDNIRRIVELMLDLHWKEPTSFDFPQTADQERLRGVLDRFKIRSNVAAYYVQSKAAGDDSFDDNMSMLLKGLKQETNQRQHQAYSQSLRNLVEWTCEASHEYPLTDELMTFHCK